MYNGESQKRHLVLKYVDSAKPNSDEQVWVQGINCLKWQKPHFHVISFSLQRKSNSYMSRDVRKPAFCICENKDADQLRGNREADQRLCFRYTNSTIPLLSKYEISSLQPSSVAVQPRSCGTWSETPKTGFLTTRLI